MNTTYAIKHRMEVEASPEALYTALTTEQGLASWWTPMISTEGSVIKFRFGDGKSGADMRVDETIPEERVVWTCIDGPWPEMRFIFSIAPHERGAVLHFDHEGWSEEGDFFRHCNMKWGYFLASSLKPLLESGKGAPHPLDPSI